MTWTDQQFRQAVIGWTVLAVPVFFVLFFISAPYGRHAWLGGPKLPGRVAWLVMEAPSPLVMAWLFATGTHQGDPAAWCFLALWWLHYFHRAFIYPLRMKGTPRPMPVPTVVAAMCFNCINAGFNGEYLFHRAPMFGTAWLLDPRFIVGALIFIAGFAINFHADSVLLNLRKPGDTGYKIPFGGLYRYISCPNYFGEVVEWCGFAIAAWSLPAVAFVMWTAANLLPRARTNHQWYREKFPDYPSKRKAVVPFVF